MNKIEALKREKDGLDVLQDIPRYAREGWETISDSDRERLKWLGVFFRKQTPGHFMMRLRIPNGISNAAQFRALAEIGRRFGKGFVDITTRQQIQLRWFEIGHVPEIWDRLAEVGLVSLQTGMDNIRNVVGCPAAGVTANELFDASPVVREFTGMFLGDKAYTNLPRKFNVGITGCLESCTHTDSQDIALTPAVKETNGVTLKGFNVAVGGKIGSGGYRSASPLDLFVVPEEAAALASHITLIFRDHGFREARNKSRLAFLIEDWGAVKFRAELERRVGHPLLTAGVNPGDHQSVDRSAPAAAPEGRVCGEGKNDHVGIFPQKQAGLSYVGVVVPVGRITAEQLHEVARLADVYGNGEIRLTTGQNLIISNVPDRKLDDLKAEPLLQTLRHDASEIMRGLVSCTGIDYCHFALIETKELAIQTARRLEGILQRASAASSSLETGGLSMHWSGCINGCANHAGADIGLVGKRAKVDGKTVDAVDVFLRGESAASPRIAVKVLENVPCDELPEVLEGLVPQLGGVATKGVPAPA